MNERFFGATDTGKVRTNNEDAFLAVQLPASNFTLACAIDGVGGYEGGEVAAATAKDTLLSFLSTAKGNPIDLLQQGIWEANEAIWALKEKNSQWQQMACVLTIALVDEAANTFYYAHVGDTRMYLFRDGNLVKITRDQSFVGFLEDSGRLDEAAAMNHPKRNEINKALGFEKGINSREDYIETGTSPFLPGDSLLLCSDGLTDMVPAAEMIQLLLQNPALPDAVQQLINAANEKGGKDNITVVMVRNTKKPGKQQPVVPVARQTAEPVTGQPKAAPKKQSKKRKPPLLPILLVLLLVAAAAWWVLQPKKEEPREQLPAQSMAALMVQQRLDTAKRSIILSDSIYGKRIAVTDTIIAGKDSLQLDGSGLIFIKDGAFTGPALQFSGGDLTLENMVFENFETGILMNGGTLQLKNVQFRNCTIAVSYQVPASGNKALSGFVQHSLHPDSTTSIPAVQHP